MIVKHREHISIAILLNGEVAKLSHVERWSKWLLSICGLAVSSVDDYARSLNRLWIWVLAKDDDVENDFDFFLAEYRKALKKGFEITERVFNETGGCAVEMSVLTSRPKNDQTIDKELAGIESYFNYLKEKGLRSDLSVFTDGINERLIHHAKVNSESDGYGLSMRTTSKEVWAKRKKAVKRTSKNPYDDYRAFPFELFEELVELANPREKLIYLLCGGASARIGQALNFTLYDVDYDKQKVWLVDPTTDLSCGLIKISRRKWMDEKYRIDADRDKPHSSIAFKYPIPLKPRANRPLYWANEGVKLLFLKTLTEYEPIGEHLMKSPHPFAFVTRTGKRLLPSNVRNTFKRHCVILQERHPEYDLSHLGMHSLRHMYGVYMAELYGLASMGEIDVSPNEVKMYCKTGMGHRSMSSTDIYFNMRMDTEIKIGYSKISEYIKTNKVALSFMNGRAHEVN